MSHLEIVSDVFIVPSGAFPYCNSMVVLSEENTVVDPGCSLEDLRVLLRASGLEVKDIDVVLLSHIHPDHITHALRIQRYSQCRIIANEITEPCFNKKELMKEFLGFSPSNPVRSQWEELVNSRMNGALDEGMVDEVLGDRDRLSVGDITLRMLYTPGHLPDHMCIEIEEANLLFAADIDCTEFGPYYGHPNSSIPDFKRSIEKIQQTDYSGIISGHLRDPLIRDYKRALSAYAKQIDVREDLVLNSIMSGAASVEEVAKIPIIYPSHPSPVFLQFEIWMIEHHVEALLRKGLVEQRGDRLKAT